MLWLLESDYSLCFHKMRQVGPWGGLPARRGSVWEERTEVASQNWMQFTWTTCFLGTPPSSWWIPGSEQLVCVCVHMYVCICRPWCACMRERAHVCAGCVLWGFAWWICVKVCACISVCICVMVLCEQKQGGKLSFSASLWFRVTSMAAKLTSGVMLILNFNWVPTFTELDVWQEEKRLTGLV